LGTDFFGVFQEELPTLCVVENVKEEQSVMLASHIFFEITMHFILIEIFENRLAFFLTS
jgi:hypothetical protein